MTRLNVPDRCKHHQWQETSRTYMNGLPGFIKVVYMCKLCGKSKQEDKPLDDITTPHGAWIPKDEFDL